MDSEGDHGAPGEPQARNGVGPEFVGSRVREERLKQKIGVRELARRVGVSASLVSQVELGKASPSVGTLYSIVNELGISLDELFFDESTARRSPTRTEVPVPSPTPTTSANTAGAAIAGATTAGAEMAPAAPVTPNAHPDQSQFSSTENVEPVVRHGAGKVIQLATDVRWERLTPQTPQDVDFLSVTYAPGSESCAQNSLMRHSGREYGHVLEGRLGITIGFETYELGPGDSVSFESSMPHRLFTLGEQPVVAIWFVVGRRGDPRIVRNH
jgi:quercetin dioxygenase-like cupin family protein/DNA-binding XRE family transcriptional regulator